METTKRNDILKAHERYLNYINNNGQDETIKAIKEKDFSLILTMQGHMGETYEHEIYLDTTGEIHIENATTHESIFEYIDFEEYGTTQEEIDYIKYGRG